MAVARPLHPRQYDLIGQSAGDFALICGRLVLTEYPTAEFPGPVKDGGADTLLPGDSGGWTRAWQHKHFSNKIHWKQCEQSLDDVVAHYGVSHVTFCFPRDLQGAELRAFGDRLRGRHPGVTVDHWGATKLVSLLEGSEQGRTVARTFFGPVDADLDRVYRAMQVGGRLECVEDAHDRLASVGDFLDRTDAFFYYPAAVFSLSGTEPGVPYGTAISLYHEHGDRLTRVDGIPRDEAAARHCGPAGRILLPEGEVGRAALRELRDAVRDGTSYTAPEGSAITFDRLPPALKHMVGQRLEGLVSIRPEGHRPRPLKLRLSARSGDQAAHLNLSLEPWAAPGLADAAWHGRYGAFEFDLLVSASRSVSMTYRWTWDRTASVASQVRILRFVDLLERGGALALAERSAPQHEVSVRVEARGDGSTVTELLGFLENVLVIERWARRRLNPIPDDISFEQARDVARVAELIRRRGESARIRSFELEVDAEGLDQLRQGGRLALVQELTARVLGHAFPIGALWFTMTRWRLTQVEPLEGRTKVRVESMEAEPLRLEKHPGEGKAHKRQDRKRHRKRRSR